MKNAREIKVGILAVVAIFLLYFGFNFLKGVNIFSSTRAYYGQYKNLNGLVEQSPVYVLGYKVGQVDKIVYDFRKEVPFTVAFSINRDIVLPQGTQLALVSDGLLSGSALQLNIPVTDTEDCYHAGDTLPTIIVPGLVESLQNGLIDQLGGTVSHLESLIAQVSGQLEGDHLSRILANVETVTADLRVTSADLKVLMHTRVPMVINNVDSVMTDIKVVSARLSDLDLQQTKNKVDSAVDKVNDLLNTVNTNEGTLGLLLNDKDLYINLNNTINSADSLIVDLKAHPKRYVHFSLFGKKDK